MINSASYKPQSQVKIERSHGTWRRKIRYDLIHEGDCNWLKRLDEYAYQYNTASHSSIGYRSPFEVFHGREMNGTVLALESDSDDSILSDILGLSDDDAEMHETNNDNVSDPVEALISDDSDDEGKEQHIKQWLTEIDSMDKSCLEDQKKAKEKMIGRRLPNFVQQNML